MVQLADPNLEQAIRETLNKPDGELTQADLNQLTFLSAPSRAIATLDGFTNAANLIILDLNFNALSTATLTPGFPRLVRAKFRGNGLTNLIATGQLPGLTRLELSENLLTHVFEL